jgi:hypothetical protein
VNFKARIWIIFYFIKVFREAILCGSFDTPHIVETLCRIGMCFEMKNNVKHKEMKVETHWLSFLAL